MVKYGRQIQYNTIPQSQYSWELVILVFSKDLPQTLPTWPSLVLLDNANIGHQYTNVPLDSQILSFIIQSFGAWTFPCMVDFSPTVKMTTRIGSKTGKEKRKNTTLKIAPVTVTMCLCLCVYGVYVSMCLCSIFIASCPVGTYLLPC